MKRLRDVAVRMRPRIPRTPDGGVTVDVTASSMGHAADPGAEAMSDADRVGGFSRATDGHRIPARAPFMPTSRDLARRPETDGQTDGRPETDGTEDAVPGEAAPDATPQDAAPTDAPRSAFDGEAAAGRPLAPPSEKTLAPEAGAKPGRPISVPRRQIWDLEDEDERGGAPVAPQDVITDRRYLSEEDAQVTAAVAAKVKAEGLDDASADEGEDMASRARRALEARGISPDALEAESGDGAKTRVLGFHGTGLQTDAISAVAQKSATDVRFPAGWIVVVDGPGRGAYFAVTNSVSSIGRAVDQSISLNFGDASVSRHNHAAIAYDSEQNRFFLGHGNKSNIVRRNGQPVLATEELSDGDIIRIGRTTLRFVALCGPDFTWGPDPDVSEDGEDDD